MFRWFIRVRQESCKQTKEKVVKNMLLQVTTTIKKRIRVIQTRGVVCDVTLATLRGTLETWNHLPFYLALGTTFGQFPFPHERSTYIHLTTYIHTPPSFIYTLSLSIYLPVYFFFLILTFRGCDLVCFHPIPRPYLCQD